MKVRRTIAKVALAILIAIWSVTALIAIAEVAHPLTPFFEQRGVK